MKIKRLFSAIGLGLFALASVGAGLLSAKPKAEPAKADAPTWMTNFSFFAGEITEKEGFDPSSLYVHTYRDGVGDDQYFQMFPIKTGSKYFSVNATFTDAYTFDRVQFKCQINGDTKWGQPFSTSGSKASHYKQYYGGLGSWNDGVNWTFYLYNTSNLYIEYKSITYNFQEDPANARFVASGVVSDESNYYTLLYRNEWNYCVMTLQDKDADFSSGVFSYVYETWCSMNSGTYDVILKNNNEGNGLFEFKKYQTEVDTYIYYITETASATPNNIYAYGGCEQFGAWPGKAITAVTGVVDVFPDGVIHFEGVNQKIYRIPITTGYPDGDSGIIFNYNGDESKTKNNIIAPHAGYYFSTETENNYVGPAGHAIEFLLDAEAIRNAVTAHDDIKQYSVCGISSADAADICNAFNALNDTAKQYVVRTTALTYKRDGSDGDEMVTYKDILIELSKKCGVDTGLSSSVNVLSTYAYDNPSTLIIVVSVIVILSMTSIGILIVLKKRKLE